MSKTLITAEEAKLISTTVSKRTTDYYIQKIADEILKSSRIGLNSITYHVTDIDDKVKEEVDALLIENGYNINFKKTVAPKIASYTIDWF